MNQVVGAGRDAPLDEAHQGEESYARIHEETRRNG